MANLADGDKLAARSRGPEIMADAAVEIFSRPAAEVNGKCYIDSQVLAEAGVTDLSAYGGDDPIAISSSTNHEHFFAARMAASSDPDRTAVVSGDMRLTANELSALADGGAGVIAASARSTSPTSAPAAMLPLLLFSSARAVAVTPSTTA